MTHAIVVDLPGPPELYAALHAEFLKYPTGGLLVHVARPVGDGVQVIEVWTSAQAIEQWMAAYGGPAFGALAAAGWTPPEVTPQPFAPAGLIVPAEGIVG
jgi:hypothetical protein